MFSFSRFGTDDNYLYPNVFFNCSREVKIILSTCGRSVAKTGPGLAFEYLVNDFRYSHIDQHSSGPPCTNHSNVSRAISYPQARPSPRRREVFHIRQEPLPTGTFKERTLYAIFRRSHSALGSVTRFHRDLRFIAIRTSLPAEVAP